MSTYAVLHMRKITMGPPIVAYLEGIEATLQPFQGRFVVHGGKVEVVEGAWPGHLIVIAFPDRQRARAWYESAAYQDILPLRTDNSEGDAIFVEGVSDEHRATDVLARQG
jgi:uncharacterized protein (DUF1330 family)